jgi:phosphoribosylformylglycinamidine synthase
MTEVIKHANSGGYVLGVCNGFQILTESGLLEGALLHNDNQRFICKNIYLKPASSETAITKDLDGDKAYKIPIAHGEGRYYADDATIQKLHSNNQILFQYCTEDGEVNDAVNPNGSIDNIAGVCNENRNVFGMMPHPERAADAELGNLDGKAMFESILAHC